MKEQTEETKKNLIAAAKKEFLEKGFIASSLRSICKTAGVTTGACYFFFKDKEDLFAASVQDFANGLSAIFKAHIQAEKSLFKEYEPLSRQQTPLTYDQLIEIIMQKEDEGMSSDRLVGKQVFDFVYENYETMILLFSKAAGTKYEHFVDLFIQESENHIKEFCQVICRLLDKPMIKPYVMHWLAHLMIDTYVSLFLHIQDKTEAESYLPQILASQQAALFAIFK
ncbi:MAG: TetR/AcrR family transcriptional regulator [Treponema sp.]|nr:TetR/AcrR family transcriptional regulator [Treponema sp.]